MSANAGDKSSAKYEFTASVSSRRVGLPLFKEAHLDPRSIKTDTRQGSTFWVMGGNQDLAFRYQRSLTSTQHPVLSGAIIRFPARNTFSTSHVAIRGGYQHSASQYQRRLTSNRHPPALSRATSSFPALHTSQTPFFSSPTPRTEQGTFSIAKRNS